MVIQDSIVASHFYTSKLHRLSNLYKMSQLAYYIIHIYNKISNILPLGDETRETFSPDVSLSNPPSCLLRFAPSWWTGCNLDSEESFRLSEEWAGEPRLVDLESIPPIESPPPPSHNPLTCIHFAT